MNRPRITRWLRITWIVCCGIAFVALMVLWVSRDTRANSVGAAVSGGGAMRYMGIEDWFTIACVTIFIGYTVVHFYRKDQLSFSLRTLLIAIAIIAILLGTVVVLSR